MKSPATFALIAINVIIYIWEVSTGGLASTYALMAHGAIDRNSVLVHGEYWRIYTSAFLHGGLAHIALNMFALLQIGSFLESILGSWRMVAIYFIAMTGGGLCIAYFSAPDEATVGASGAIFGIFGAVLAVGLRLGPRGKSLISQMLPVVILNLAFTFAIPYISKAGHIGGLVSGFLAGLVFFSMHRVGRPAAVVTDRQTGVVETAEYLAPTEPNEPTHFPGAS